MANESIFTSYEDRTDEEKILSELKSIDENLSCVNLETSQINTLLAAEVLGALRDINSSIRAVGSWVSILTLLWLFSKISEIHF